MTVQHQDRATDFPEEATVAAAVPAAPLDDVGARYSRPARRGQRRLLAVLGVALAVVAFTLVAVSALDRDVRWRDVGFTVVDPGRVQVRFEVYGDPGDMLRCQVRAADARYGDVGQVEVDLGPLPVRGLAEEVEVRTVAPASSASVRTCVVLPQRLS